MGAGRSSPSGPSPVPNAGRSSGLALPFDFGERGLGVAVGDLALKISHPLETIDAADPGRRFERIAALVAEWRPVLAVVGMPVTVEGSPHALAPRVRAFCRQLERRFGLPTASVDERFTSAEAGERLSAAGVRGRAQKAYLDQVAASAILDDYFARHDDTDA